MIHTACSIFCGLIFLYQFCPIGCLIRTSLIYFIRKICMYGVLNIKFSRLCNMYIILEFKIKNGHGKCVTETTTQPKCKNSTRPPIGLQHIEKITHPERGFSWSKGVSRFCSFNCINYDLSLLFINILSNVRR